jgi:hypothetical protein
MKIILKNAALAFLILLAHTATAASPEELTSQYYHYVDTSQWNKIADMLHESALGDFKAQMLPLLNTQANSGSSGLLKKTFGKQATYEDAKNASEKVFFINVVSNIAGLMRNSGIKNTQTAVLGRIAENDELVHVLVRERYTLGDMHLTNMEVLSYKQVDKDWALLLSGKIHGLVQTLQTSMYQIRNRKKTSQQ